MKQWQNDDTFLARWLSGELSKEELRAFEASEEYDDFAHLLNAFEDVSVPSYNKEAELAKLKGNIDSKPKPKSKQVFIGKWIYYAAACVILLLTGTWWQYSSPSATQVIALENQHHDLPDGSYVEMSSGSSISYTGESWDVQRIVKLEGEAFFEVKKGEQFKVQLSEGLVTVLGTSFNVFEGSNALIVTCYTGKVLVEAYGQNEILLPGEQVVFEKGRAELKLQTRENSPGWMKESITLSRVTLEEALTELEVNFHVNIEGQVSDTSKHSFSFPTDDLNVALSQVLGPVGLEYSYSLDKKSVTIE